jgi:hypothetical protein
MKASTLSLTVLVVIEMFNALNALSEDISLLVMPPWLGLPDIARPVIHHILDSHFFDQRASCDVASNGCPVHCPPPHPTLFWTLISLT